MSFFDGVIVSVVACAVTLTVISVAGLALVVVHMQEARVGNGCQPGGCRRSRTGQGCKVETRTAEPDRVDSNWRD